MPCEAPVTTATLCSVSSSVQFEEPDLTRLAIEVQTSTSPLATSGSYSGRFNIA
jgi:hypothetical protein